MIQEEKFNEWRNRSLNQIGPTIKRKRNLSGTFIIINNDINLKLNIDAKSEGSFMSDEVPNVEYGHPDQNIIVPNKTKIGLKSVKSGSKSDSVSVSNGNSGSSGNMSFGE